MGRRRSILGGLGLGHLGLGHLGLGHLGLGHLGHSTHTIARFSINFSLSYASFSSYYYAGEIVYFHLQIQRVLQIQGVPQSEPTLL